jgi:NTP pyrophosphatase (non-canonical NTP hydrolase)
MSDRSTLVSDLRDAWRQFITERDWEQFHSPRNLVMALACEAAELMEHFQWIDNDESRKVVLDPAVRAAVADEIADVAGVVFALCNALDLDLSDAMRDKMARNALKYPVERCRGKFRVE